MDTEYDGRSVIELHDKKQRLVTCTKCGGKFLRKYSERYQECLDCRSDDSERKQPSDVYDVITQHAGHRLVSGFRLLGASDHIDNT